MIKSNDFHLLTLCLEINGIQYHGLFLYLIENLRLDYFYNVSLMFIKHEIAKLNFFYNKYLLTYLLMNKEVSFESLLFKEIILLLILNLKNSELLKETISCCKNDAFISFIKRCLVNPNTKEIDFLCLDFDDVINNEDKIPLIKAFIQISELQEKNVLNEEPFNVKKLFVNLKLPISKKIILLDKEELFFSLLKELYISFLDFLLKKV